VLALAGLAGLLLVLVVSVVLIAGAAGGGEEEAAATTAATTPTATATPMPTRTPKPKPTPPPLTAQQRAERQAAADIVRSRGFEVVRLRDYDPRDTLRVLIGRTGGGGMMAFFFAQGDYLGNDATSTSARLRVRRRSDLAVTLRYTVADPSSTTSSGAPRRRSVDVRFVWDGSRLSPQAPVPDASVRAPGSLG
jgi:hypothetical protein